MSLSEVTEFSANLGFITSIIERFLVVIFCVLYFYIFSVLLNLEERISS